MCTVHWWRSAPNSHHYETYKQITDSQQTRLSSELLLDADNSWRSRFITSEITGRDEGSTDNIKRISSSNDAE